MSNDDPMKAFTPEDQDQSDKPAQHQGENPKVLYIPVEPTGEAMKHAIKTDPGKAVHNIALNDLDSAFNALFAVCKPDSQLIRALDAAYCYMVDEMQYEHATVCGIGVGVAINVIGSLLAHAPDTASGALSPDAAQLRAEITAKFPDTVQRLFGLEVERKRSAGNDGAKMAQHPYPEAHETPIIGNEEGRVMKRSKFMDSVSSGALIRKKITGAEFKWHEALSRLSEDFRDGITWFGPQTPIALDGQVVRMARLPHDEPNPTEGVSIVFVDRTKHAGPPEEIALAAVRNLWGECLNHIRAMNPDFFKVGSVVWDDLDMHSEPDWVADLLGLKKGDANIARAFHAALIGTFISNPKKTDLEDIVVAIGNFIHALPAFSKLVEGGKWQPPYGDRTAYKLLR